MKLSMPKGRMAILLPILLVAAGLAMFGDRTPAGAVHPLAPASRGQAQGTSDIQRVTGPSARSKPAAAVPLEILVPREQLARSDADARDLFASPAWLTREIKVAPPPAAPVAAAPVAPPAAVAELALPFKFVGKRQEGDEWEVYLARDDVNFIAKVGATVDVSFRVEAIAPPTIVLIHLPTGKSHSLSIGEAR